MNFSDEDKEKNPYYTAIDLMKAGNFDNIINLCTEEINQGTSINSIIVVNVISTLKSNNLCDP